MSVPILDRQQTNGSGVGLSAVVAAADAAGADDVAASLSSTQQVTGGSASCGQKLINLSTESAPPSSSSTRREASQPPQSQSSISCIGTDAATSENTRSPFDGRRQQEQERRANDCDKNKQHDDCDAQEACTKQTLDSQSDLGGARQTNHEEGARSTISGAELQLRFKLPNLTSEAASSLAQAASDQHSTQINISGSSTAPIIGPGTNNKPLVATRHHSTIEMSDTPVAGRMLKRKTSVFSHSGFIDLHKLDQSAIQQHVIASTAPPTSNVLREDAALQQQVDKSKTDQSPSSCKATTVAASSPRQPYRSDTLGSTGSSRASSCDEPTIVSPTKLSASNSLAAKEHPASKNLTTIPSKQDSTSSSVVVSPLNSLAKRLVAGDEVGHKDNYADDVKSTMMQCDNEDDDAEINAHERGAKQTYSRKSQQQGDNTSDEDDDEEDDDEEDEDDEVDDESNKNNCGERPQRVSLSTNFRESLKIPPFESIKTQIKKNSIPNAEDIKRHIDKVISRNEEIIDNWNQVSIRSYNSSGTTAAGSAASATTGAAGAAAANKRPSKRWSTTALCTKGNSIVLNQPGEHNETSSSGKPISGIERKRSQIHQHPVRRVSQQHKPLTIFNEPQPHQANTCTQQQQQHLIVQTATGSAYCPSRVSAYCPSQVSLSMPSSPKQIVNPFLDARNQTNYQNHALNPAHQTIESAIENLSLKKRHDDPIEHSLATTTTTNRDDLVMAALLVERQRQQQLLDEYLRQQAVSDHHNQMVSFPHQSQPQVGPPPSLPNPILDHYQQQLTSQQQQQLIEHQLGLSRLAALEGELMQQRQQQQQAVANLMSAATLQNQQSLAAASGSTLAQADQFNQQVALENQLLNEYLAKMILSRQQDHQQQQQYKPQPMELAVEPRGAARSSPSDQHNGARPVGPFQVSPTSPSRVYLGHGSELQTQSLDSATPSYRCEACDISFWTRDLLNYHSMTSCSARTGPRPSKPIAFSFNQPNGFDSTTTVAASSLAALQARQGSGAMQSPMVIVSCADTGQSTSTSSATSYAHSPQKPLGPARRRTYDELNAPSSPYMATYRDLLVRENHHNQQQQQQHLHQRQVSTSSIDYRQPQHVQNQRQLSPLGSGKSALVAPKSPHKTRESAELAWQQRLEELSILKQQLLLNAGLGPPSGMGGDLQRSLHVQQVTLSGNENKESKLPIKKRKISEPNMKY